MRALTLALLTFLLIIPATAAAEWDQFGGDIYRSGMAGLPQEPLDVVSTFRLFDGTMTSVGLDLGFVDTKHGLMGLVFGPPEGLEGEPGTGTGCLLLRVPDVDAGTVEEVARFPCENGGKLLGYDGSRDLLFISVEGPLPDDLLRFVDAEDGTEVWSTGPQLQLPTTPGLGDQGDWWADDAVLDTEGGMLYVPYASDNGEHSIEALDIEARRSVWQTVVPIERALDSIDLGGVPDPMLPGEEARTYPATWTLMLTGTDTGLVVVMSANPQVARRVAWMDYDGQIIGTWGSEGFCCPDGEASTMVTAPRATAQGTRAVAHIDDRLVFVDPASSDFQLVPVPQQRPPGIWWVPSPVWIGDHVVAPVVTNGHIHAPTRGELALWPGYQGAEIAQVIGTPEGAGYAIVIRGEGESTRNALVQLDLDDARSIHALPIPTVGSSPHLLPLRDAQGLLVWDDDAGLAVLLASADEELLPAVSIDTSYPAADQPVTIEATAANAGRLVVGWGNGAIDQATPGQPVSRAFAEPGLRTLRVTAVYEDGRTGTTEVPIFVGQEAPQDLNALQSAFAPENQDMTFGVLGVALALGGGLIAVGRRRTRRSRLQRELDAVDALAGEAAGNPARLEAVVRQRRTHVRALVVDGKLEEGQAQVVERRLDEVLGQARMGELDDLLDQLPFGLVCHLREALADGTITRIERDSLLSLVEQDGLVASDVKDEVRERVEAWFQRDAGSQGVEG